MSSDVSPVSPASPTRLRTEKAILETAAQIFPLDPQSSLADIAQAADVSRSTIHRYFSERTDLVKALAVYAYKLCDAAILRASNESNDPLAMLRNVAANQLEIGPLMTFLYQDPSISADADFWTELRADGDPIDAVLVRAAGDDAPLPIAWMRRTYWNMLYVGWETSMEQSMTSAEIVDAIMLSLTSGILTPAHARP